MAGFAVPLALGAGRESNATRLEIGVFVILSAAMAAILGALAPVAPVHPTLGFAAAGLSLVLATLLVWAAPLHVPPAPASGVSTQTLAMVAHELRTPLNHIIGFADVMDQRLLGPLPDVYADYPGLISNAGRHQLDLVNLLVDFGRLEAGRYPYTPEPIAPGAIVEEIVRGAAGGAGDKNIALDLDLSRAPSVAHLDPRSWRQMLYNLIGNAVKFTLAGGRVTIGLAQIDSMLRLEVSDTGPGLSDAEKQRIGALYERSEAATGIEGAGLGLAVTMALAALHGGRLSLHDNLASGLMVRVDLPNAP
jgi:cell cycle sensor histidine kinase DivJ